MTKIEQKEKVPMDHFLFFYKDFLWKNKEMMKLLEIHSKYYKDRFIKIPTIYTVDDDIRSFLNSQLIEREE